MKCSFEFIWICEMIILWKWPVQNNYILKNVDFVHLCALCAFVCIVCIWKSGIMKVVYRTPGVNLSFRLFECENVYMLHFFICSNWLSNCLIISRHSDTSLTSACLPKNKHTVCANVLSKSTCALHLKIASL